LTKTSTYDINVLSDGLMGNNGNDAEQDDAQLGDGYGCSCGFITDSLTEFRKHFWHKGKKEPGKHKSIGRVNLLTGDVTMPPYLQRTKEQIALTRHGKGKKKTSTEEEPGRQIGPRGTDTLANAQEVRFVPRVYTVDYSPIMRGAQEAATRVWGWRPDMPLGNFLDTVIYNYFKEHGITLAAYVIEEEEPVHGS
jgi:hypothetical protein